jgi:hypothetical protein
MRNGCVFLERLKKYCSHSVKGMEKAVFLAFGFVSAQLQGVSNLLLRRSLAKSQKSPLRNGYSIFLTALEHRLAAFPGGEFVMSFGDCHASAFCYTTFDV